MSIVFDGAVGPYERVVWATDRPTGMKAIIAIHSTALGPALGGVRFAPYPDDASAMIDALRLAEGMSVKAAFAGLDVGGGKSVIIGDPRAVRTVDLLRAFGALIDRLGGSYWAAEDVGTSPADMDVIGEVTPYVAGLTTGAGADGGDPSPFTSRGVYMAMRAAWEWAGAPAPGLSGARVAIQGVGKVGAELAALVAADGAEVAIADADPTRARLVANWVGGRVVATDAILTTPCDILAPCALGGLLSADTVSELSCRFIVGSANNQLASDAVAARLADADVVYVPDFVANAGGVIAVAERRMGTDGGRIDTRIDAIGERVHEILDAAHDDGHTPLHHALAIARRRLTHAGAPA